ncbi:MAG: protein-disulfide reductase DsbD domain-containing protein [Candidatus Acidiferrales bacterium]
MKARPMVARGLFLASVLAVVAMPVKMAFGQSASRNASELPTGASVVKPSAFVSLDAVPAGHTFEVAIVADILSGYHMNSHKPSEEYLIPTAVTLVPVKGFREVGSVYPEGQLLKFDFSQDKLSVYSGKVTVRIKLAAELGAPLGDATLPFTLRFQACNATACLPPAKVQIPVTVKVVAADAKAHATHPEIFPQASK